jgi:hypothetical protein
MSTVTVHGYAISQTSTLVNTVLLYAVIAATLVLRYRTRLHRPNVTLEKGERLRPLLTIPMDTALTLVFVGLVLFDLATRNVWHAASAAAGGFVGLRIGQLRARVQYVRAESRAQSVVVRRSTVEYGVLVLLLGIRIAEDYVVKSHTTAFTCILAALMTLALTQSIVRSVLFVRRYRNDVAATRALAEPT